MRTDLAHLNTDPAPLLIELPFWAIRHSLFRLSRITHLIQWTAGRNAQLVQRMRVDHRRLHVHVALQLLHGPDNRTTSLLMQQDSMHGEQRY